MSVRDGKVFQGDTIPLPFKAIEVMTLDFVQVSGEISSKPGSG